MQLSEIWRQKGQNIEGEQTSDYSGTPEGISLSNDGNRFIIGAAGNDGDSVNGSDRGHSRIFEWNGTIWQQIGQEIIGDANNDLSGEGASISGDGNKIVIGAIKYDNNENDTGKVTVFQYNGTVWEPVGEPFYGKNKNDQLGYDVSLSYDGNKVAFGAHWNETNSYKGLVYVYEWNGTQWEQLGNEIEGDFFGDRMGYNVALSDDGNRLCINSQGFRDDNSTAEVYEYDGTNWVQLGDNIDDLKGGSRSVSDISGDGNSIIVSRPDYENNKGIVRVFRWDGSQWIQLGDSFIGEEEELKTGYDAKIAYDGDRIVIGTLSFSNNNFVQNGNFKVYDWNGSSWEQVGNTIYGLSDQMKTGGALDISGDGKTVLDGGWGYNSNTGLSRVFESIKIVSSSNDEEIVLEPNEEIGGSSRNEYFESLKPYLDLNKKILVSSSFFNKDILSKNFTEILYSSVSSSYIPSDDNDVYVIMENDNDEITFSLDNEKTLKIIRVSSSQYAVYENGSESPSYTQEKGDQGEYEGFEWEIGSIFGSLLNKLIICFGPNETVHTDQGEVIIKDIKEEEHSIRGMKVKKLTKNRCKRSKMVLIQKDAFEPNIPNKETKITLDHQVYFAGRMRPIHRLLHKEGISLIESNHQVVYNVMLSEYSYMKVNNMVVETLDPRYH